MQTAVVIRLSALGDVLLTAPAVAALARTHRVVFVTDPAYAPLVAGFVGVSEVRPLERQQGLGGARTLGEELRSLNPDVVIDLQNKVRTQVLARATGASIRTLARRSWGQSALALLGHDTVLNDEHQAVRYLKECVGSSIGPLQLELKLDPRWAAAADETTSKAAWKTAPYAIAPAATHATKGWPVERFADVARRIIPAGAPLLLVAGPKDSEAVARFKTALGEWPSLLDASGLPLTTMAALLARCRLLIGNDSGPIHLATALGVPTAAVFGPTSAVRWGPLPGMGDHHRVARLPLECSPCSNHGGPKCPRGHHDCMVKLPAEAVEREARALI